MKALILSAAVLAGLPAAAQDTTTGLVSHWPMDTVGATTPDVAGPNTFTCVNGPTAAAGFIAGAIRLDGTNDHLTAVDDASLNFGSGSFTVALWIRPTSTTDVRLINKWDGPAQQGWIMDIHSTTGGGASVGHLRFRLDSNAAGNNTGVDNIDYSANGNLGSGAWRHVAAVVDRGASQLRLYVNGAQIGTSQTLPATLTSLSNTFQLGLGTIPTAAGKYYAGDVDDVRLYGRALTAADLMALVQPAAPLLVDPPGVTGGDVTLDWSAVSGATSYQVYRMTDPMVGFTPQGAPTTLTTATISGLAVGTYFFRVTAFNGIADSPPSNVVQAVIVPPPPRTKDHDEGLIGDDCACGASATSPALALAGLAGLLLLLLRR